MKIDGTFILTRIKEIDAGFGYDIRDIHLISISIFPTDNPSWIRSIYWVIPGEIRQFDIDIIEYSGLLRDWKLKELGI